MNLSNIKNKNIFKQHCSELVKLFESKDYLSINQYIDNLKNEEEACKLYSFIGEHCSNNQNHIHSVKFLEKSLIHNPPNKASILAMLGVNLAKIPGCTQKAIETLLQSIQANPNLIGIHQSLGAIYFNQGLHYRAYLHFLEDIKLTVSQNQKPNINLLKSCASMANSIGLADLGCHLMKQAIEQDPTNITNYQTLLYIASHSEHYLEKDMSKIAKDIYQNCLEKKYKIERENIKSIRNNNNYLENSRIRLGIISSSFFSGAPESIFLEQLQFFDRNDFEIYCYYNNDIKDPITEKFIETSTEFKFINRYSNPYEIAEIIAKDKIHILFDTVGHLHRDFAPSSIEITSLKPAPIQVTGLDYWSSNSLPEIDYLISCEGWLSPDDKSEFSEEVLSLPVYLFKPKVKDIEIKEPPCINNNFITFGCLNRRDKLNEKLLSIWALILKLVSDSQILLSSNLPIDPLYKKWLLSIFKTNGIDENRIILLDKLSSEEYFETYNKIDIALDPFPFNGGCTTVDTLYMGTPLITKDGLKSVSRFSKSILNTVGIGELSANSLEDYVFKAIELAKDKMRIINYKNSLRTKLIDSDLINPEVCAQHYTQLFKEIYRRHFK